MSELIENILHEVNKLEEGAYFGKVTGVQGLFIEVSGIRTRLSIGDQMCIRDSFKHIGDFITYFGNPAADRLQTSFQIIL